jgi:hypothetical protein
MNIPGYSQLNDKEKEVLHALLDLEGIKVVKADIVDAKSTSIVFNWCKIICGVKAAVAALACGWNPVCIAKAVVSGLECANACK